MKLAYALISQKIMKLLILFTTIFNLFRNDGDYVIFNACIIIGHNYAFN